MRLPPVPLHALELIRRVMQNLEVESQLRARRNALIASTALAQRRAELNELEELLAGSAPATGDLPPVDPASRIHARPTAMVSQ
jgi:hypothetical protein